MKRVKGLICDFQRQFFYTSNLPAENKNCLVELDCSKITTLITMSFDKYLYIK